MSINVNGVTLPDIPVVEGYPCATISKTIATREGQTIIVYTLGLCTAEFAIVPAGIQIYEGEAWTNPALVSGNKNVTTYEFAEGYCTEWETHTEGYYEPTHMGTVDYTSVGGPKTTAELVWANHDVCLATAYDYTTMIPTVGTEIYFPSSVVAEPEYGKIRIQIVRDIANSIRSKTGNTAKLTPEQMASEIDGIATIDELCDDEAVEITSNATTIPRYIFYKNSTLKTINLPRCTCVKQNAFNEATTLTTVNAPNCTSIDMDAFKGCKNLNNINLPSLVTLGVNVFSACSNLKYVDLPLCTSLKNSVFQQCTSLVSVIAPSVSVIDQYAFYNCTNVKLIDLSSCVTLNNHALYYTKNLSALVLRSEEICILQSVNAFQISSIASGTGYIYVRSALIDSYKGATNWRTYANQIRAIEDYPDICGE